MIQLQLTKNTSGDDSTGGGNSNVNVVNVYLNDIKESKESKESKDIQESNANGAVNPVVLAAAGLTGLVGGVVGWMFTNTISSILSRGIGSGVTTLNVNKNELTNMTIQAQSKIQSEGTSKGPPTTGKIN